MKTRTSFEVYEDSGGGLYLITFSDDHVANAYSGYEYRPGALLDDIAALFRDGGDWGWDSAEEDPQDLFEELTFFSNAKLIAEGDIDGRYSENKLTVYFDNLGAAGIRNFGHILPAEAEDED